MDRYGPVPDFFTEFYSVEDFISFRKSQQAYVYPRSRFLENEWVTFISQKGLFPVQTTMHVCDHCNRIHTSPLPSLPPMATCSS